MRVSIRCSYTHPPAPVFRFLLSLFPSASSQSPSLTILKLLLRFFCLLSSSSTDGLHSLSYLRGVIRLKRGKVLCLCSCTSLPGRPIPFLTFCLRILLGRQHQSLPWMFTILQSMSNTMAEHATSFRVPDVQRTQRPNLVIPPQARNRPEALGTSPISTETDRLITHPHFELYSPVSRDLLAAPDKDWCNFLIIRRWFQAMSFGRHFASIYYTPPPDMINIIARIRSDKSWQGTRQDILIRVDNACPQPQSSWTTFDATRHRPPQGNHLIPDTARSRSRGRQVRSPQSFMHGPPRPEYQSSSRGGGPSTAGSPTPAEGHLAAANAVRTAPEGYLFYCPSQNCPRSYPRQGYTRQGHFENHMRVYHTEWGSHDPSKSLLEIPGHEHANAEKLQGPGDSMTLEEAACSETTPQPTFANPLPHTPIPLSDLDAGPLSALNADNVLPHIIQFGTEPQISLPLLDLLEEALLTTPFPNNLTGLSRLQYDMVEGQQHLLHTPSSQASSSFNQSYWSPDSFMGGQ